MTFFRSHPRRAGVLVSLFTTALLAAALEAAFPWLIPHVPPSLQRHLPPPLQVLAQSSKSGLVPRDYTAILGDSYALGEGDWRLGSSGLANRPYQAAHLLHEAGFGDVVALGRAGGGSLAGIALAPLAGEAYLDALGRFAPLGAPRTTLVYFYEGNDLNDNLRALRAMRGRDSDPKFDEREFQARIDSMLKNARFAREARTMNWRARILSGPFFKGVALQVLRGERAHPARASAGRWQREDFNRARVGGVSLDLPPRLQGPALELTDDERREGTWVFEQSVRFVMRHWRSSRFTLVYVPSPLSCYTLEGEQVTAQAYEGHGHRFAVGRVGQNSDRIADGVRRVALTVGAGFIDTRPELRAEAARSLIHGPRDWKHFNRTGYEALARALVANLRPAVPSQAAEWKAGT